MTHLDPESVRPPEPTPFEPEGGQDDGQPDLLLAIIVAIRLLRDLGHHLDPEHEHEEPSDEADLLLRIGAVLRVLRRVRDRLEDK